jgi:hypothetical protein
MEFRLLPVSGLVLCQFRAGQPAEIFQYFQRITWLASG